jgi:hypothetical protein
MLNQPAPIAETNLSHAWGRALLHVIKASPRRLAPMIVSIQCDGKSEPAEDLQIRDALDALLAKTEKKTCDETAATIFPHASWVRRGKPNCDEFSNWYLNEYMKRHRARVRVYQGKIIETYFERMIAFGGESGAGKGVDQLKEIVRIWQRDQRKSRRPRRSALQVACFDPRIDSTGAAMSGFPCLQQVSFIYDDEGNFAVNAYYPTQYIFDRAYGNYLGLCQLGQFMAHQLGMDMIRLNCFIGHPELGRGVTKGELADLVVVLNRNITLTEDSETAAP